MTSYANDYERLELNYTRPLDTIHSANQSRCKTCLIWSIPALLAPIMFATSSLLYSFLDDTIAANQTNIILTMGIAKIFFFLFVGIFRICKFYLRYGVLPSFVNSGLYELTCLESLKAKPRYAVIIGLTSFGALYFCHIFAILLPFSPVQQTDVVPLFQSAFLVSLIALQLILHYCLQHFQKYTWQYFLGVGISISGLLLIINKDSLTQSFSSKFSEIVLWLVIGLFCLSAIALMLYYIKKWMGSYFIHFTISFALIILADGILRIGYGIIGNLLADSYLTFNFQSALICLGMGFTECIGLVSLIMTSMESMIGPALSMVSLVPFFKEIGLFILHQEVPTTVVIIGIALSLVGCVILIITIQIAVMKQNRNQQPLFAEELFKITDDDKFNIGVEQTAYLDHIRSQSLHSLRSVGKINDP